MSLLSALGISSAHAAANTTATNAAGHHAAQSSLFGPMLIMVGFIALMYFFMIRPQNRKRKERESLVNQIGVGDDVVTIGGMVGRVSKLKDDFIELTIAKDTHVTMQKASIANVLPKGTFEE